MHSSLQLSGVALSFLSIGALLATILCLGLWGPALLARLWWRWQTWKAGIFFRRIASLHTAFLIERDMGNTEAEVPQYGLLEKGFRFFGFSGESHIQRWISDITQAVESAYALTSFLHVAELLKKYRQDAQDLKDRHSAALATLVEKKMKLVDNSAEPPVYIMFNPAVEPEEHIAHATYKRQMGEIRRQGRRIILVAVAALLMASIDSLAIYLTFQMMFRGTADNLTVVLFGAATCATILILFLATAHLSLPILMWRKGQIRPLHWICIILITAGSVLTARVRIDEMMGSASDAVLAMAVIIAIAIPAASFTAAWLMEVTASLWKGVKEASDKARQELEDNAPTLLAISELESEKQREKDAVLTEYKEERARLESEVASILRAAEIANEQANQGMINIVQQVLNNPAVQLAIEAAVNGVGWYWVNAQGHPNIPSPSEFSQSFQGVTED